MLMVLFINTVSAQGNKNVINIDTTITGHYILKYKNVSNQLHIEKVSNDRIRFHLIALLLTGSDSPHHGEIRSEIDLKENIATYQDGSCKITFKFNSNAVKVYEENVDDCGFGAFVTASGKYIKKSNEAIFNK
jgi:hypothetical protein